MKIVTAVINILYQDGRPAQSLTKHKDKEMNDQLIYRTKLSLSTQCHRFCKPDNEVELVMTVNNLPFYRVLFKDEKIVPGSEQSHPLTMA